MKLTRGSYKYVKNPVQDCDWVFVSKLVKYKSPSFVWRGARMASLVYGTSWNSSNMTESRRSFMWETVAAIMLTVGGRLSWLYPYGRHESFALRPPITVVMSTNTKLCSVTQADEYETIWWLGHPWFPLDETSECKMLHIMVAEKHILAHDLYMINFF
jgi:hypothetical protein